MRRADQLYVSLALIAEAARYVLSAGSTKILVRMFKRSVHLEPMTEAFFAGAAANRTFSTAGAPGMVIRLMFLMRQGVDAGQVAVIYLIEDIIGFFIGVLIFVLGIIGLVNAHPSNLFILNATIAFAAGSAILAIGGIYIYRRRTWVERGVHAVARWLNMIVAWFLGRPLYTPERVQQAVDEFYAGMPIVRRAPLNVLASFALNLLRYLAGAIALYFAFLALGWSISPGVLILIYTSVSVLSAVSAVPGELAIMGGSWAILTLSFGVPKDIAMMALLLSRTIAFWMPIPIGALALWNLRRQRML